MRIGDVTVSVASPILVFTIDRIDMSSNEVSRLEEKIKYYSQAYYSGEPEISDDAFDLMVEQLRRIDPDNELLGKVGWGQVITSDLDATKKHKFEVLKFEDKIRQISKLQISKDEGVITPKIDGGSICCYYVNGHLDCALTRGDGVTGFDVTDKMSYIVPTSLIDDSFSGMVRGEITINEKLFDEKFSSDYDSNRNLAVGQMRRKEITVEELNDLTFVAYTVRGVSSTLSIDSKQSVFNWIRLNGFNCVDVLPSPDVWSDESFRDLILEYRELHRYPVDGIVVTTEQYKELPDRTFVPVSEVAYKTASDSLLVDVKGIEWNLTRTGRMTPVVTIEPVFLSGAWISRASAFNAKWVRDSGIGIGSTVRIQRSGEVIPNIVEVITDGDLEFPEVCPSCGKRLEWVSTELRCQNPRCDAKDTTRIYTWINTIAPIKGLGKRKKDLLLNNMEISSIEGLYDVIDEIVSRSPSFARPATVNLYKDLVRRLQGDVVASDFFVACSIPGCGKSAGKALGEHLDLILYGPLNQETKDQILEIKGANINAKTWLVDHLEDVRKLATFVKSVVPDDEDTVESTGRTSTRKLIAVTGRLSVTRSKFFEEMAYYGYEQGGVSSADYLITNDPDSMSSKMNRAKESGVTILSENDFRHMVGAPLAS